VSQDKELNDEELELAAGGKAISRASMDPEGPGIEAMESDQATMPPPTGGRDMRRKIRRHDPPTRWAEYQD